MGSTATVIAISFTIACVLGIAFVVYIARSTRRAGAAAPDAVALAEREKTWFVVVVVLLVSLLVATIFFTPYGRTASAGAQIEKIEGIQFAWLIPSAPLKAHRQVEFELTSGDVNHSFAVYTMSGELLFQVEVVPGMTTDYIYTFKHPGTYRVICLEYCGVGHALMQSELTVTA